MGEKTEDQVKEERRQRAEAIARARRVNPGFQKEKLEKAAQYALKKYGQFFPPGEGLNNPDYLLVWLNGHNPEFWTEFLNISPEGQELQAKYGLSFPLTFENLLQMPEDMADWGPHILLKDGGKAVSLLSLEDGYLTIRVNLRERSTTIDAEIKAMIKAKIQEFKSTNNFARPSVFPGDLEFEVFKLYKQGSKPKQIIAALKSKLNYDDRGQKEYVARAIKKVQSWIDAVSPEIQ